MERTVRDGTAKVVRLPRTAETGVRQRDAGGGSATVLLFTGVRYERPVEAEPVGGRGHERAHG